MPIDERWRELTPSDSSRLAQDWLAELRSNEVNPEPNLGLSVVILGSADPERQWLFIREAVAWAETDGELGHVAAGPMEHLLRRHGAEIIDAVEAQAAADPKFARMLGGAWNRGMIEEVSQRILTLRSRHPRLSVEYWKIFYSRTTETRKVCGLPLVNLYA